MLKKILIASNDYPSDLSETFATNCEVLEDLPKPGYFNTNDQEKATVNWNCAKDFLKELQAAQECIEHTHATLQLLLDEIDSFVDQCRDLDATHREMLKKLFSKTVISFAPPPQIQNDWLFHAIKERLATRMRYIEQFMANVRSYNNVVREIRHYYDKNLHKPFIGAAYIEGFPKKEQLPNEIKIN